MNGVKADAVCVHRSHPAYGRAADVIDTSRAVRQAKSRGRRSDPTSPDRNSPTVPGPRTPSSCHRGRSRRLRTPHVRSPGWDDENAISDPSGDHTGSVPRRTRAAPQICRGCAPSAPTRSRPFPLAGSTTNDRCVPGTLHPPAPLPRKRQGPRDPPPTPRALDDYTGPSTTPPSARPTPQVYPLNARHRPKLRNGYEPSQRRLSN